MKEAIPDTISGINDILVPETEEPSKDPPPVSASRRDGKAVEETISWPLIPSMPDEEDGIPKDRKNINYIEEKDGASI